MGKEALLKRIADKTAPVGVVGLGYVGLPLAVEFAKAGYTVVGVDPQQSKVDKLNAGESYIPDVPTAELAPLVAAGKLRGTTDYAAMQDMDAALICVPTPLRKTKDPDMSFIYAATDALAPYMHREIVVVLESTTYPGTTEEVVVPRLTGTNNLVVGEDVFIAFSPERVDPGNPVYQTHNTPKVVGGMTPDCVEVVVALYSAAIQTVVPVSSPGAAEMVKLLENTFRSVNIGLVNEMAIMCDKLGINVWEVIDAAATKPFGFMPFHPGPGLGRH